MKKPEVLFNRVAKRICEFVLVTLFEATCKRRAVSEVQNRVSATSRSGQILCVRPSAYFFCRPLLEKVDVAEPASTRKIVEKKGIAPVIQSRTRPLFGPRLSEDPNAKVFDV